MATKLSLSDRPVPLVASVQNSDFKKSSKARAAGAAPQQTAPLFDHLVCNLFKMQGHVEAERAASRSGALTHKEMRYGDIGRSEVRSDYMRKRTPRPRASNAPAGAGGALRAAHVLDAVNVNFLIGRSMPARYCE
jgi:hypothetical protein